MRRVSGTTRLGLDVYSRIDRKARLRWRGLLPPLPTFLLIGAPQSGTLWLYSQLIHHPDVAVPQKEVRYFSERLHRSLRWYGSFYEGLETMAARGDMTPNYYLLTPEYIRLVRDLIPDARLLLLARDPVERAWSAYRRKRSDGEPSTTEHVERFLTKSRNRRASGLAAGSEHGRYAAALANWLRVFPREQLLVVPYDRIGSDARGVVHDVLIHIEVDPRRYPWERLSGAKVNANPQEPMPDEVRAYFCKHFAGERDALATLLQCDPLWRSAFGGRRNAGMLSKP
jgi:hypothetical protein